MTVFLFAIKSLLFITKKKREEARPYSGVITPISNEGVLQTFKRVNSS